LRSLWVRDAAPLRIDARWTLATAALAALPAYTLYANGTRAGWVIAAWNACALLGAPAAAYALQNCDRHVAARSVIPALAVTLLVSALLLDAGISRHGGASSVALPPSMP
jgi:hypothetical protein